jgi:hypothetical protein
MRFALFCFLGCLSFSRLLASAAPAPEDKIGEITIGKILEQQAAAWNRGDLKEFVASYAQHCTLIGATIRETTREQVLAHYREKYPSRGAMGKLMFSGIAVHAVDARVATATGHWRLERDVASGGPVGGVFSLVFEFVDGKWQIVMDHTS